MRCAALLLFLVGLAPHGLQARQSTAGPHGRLPAGLDCSNCHRTASWSDVRELPDFDHRRTTGFALTQGHAGVRCIACHEGARFDRPDDAACSNCHPDIHQGQLGGACTDCHNTEGFDRVDGVAVHLRSSFPLTGAHVQIACEACHADDRGGAYTPLETACVHCHRADFEAAASIDHRAAGFSENCDDCHQTMAWSGSGLFDHRTASGGFELVGVHAVLRCTSCHIVPGFTTQFEPAGPDDCVSCHQPDYDRAHAGSGFPAACAGCHDQDRWTNARFTDHESRFPIYSGAHRGEWDSCSTCHDTAGDYARFSCFNCHEHERSRTDRHHDEEPSYVYESSQCYRCHPRGRAEDD